MAVPELSLYVHVPFCLGKCSYCDFYSITDLEAAGRVTSRTIEQGARALELLGRPRLGTVYVGGGTPSALRREDLDRLLSSIGTWGGDRAVEVTVEANPETLERSFLDISAAAGVTRLSLGVQTLDPALLSLLGRRATREQTLAALELVRQRWRGDLSVDLLAGIPGQTWARLSEDIETVLAFDPQHVSLYQLTREEGTRYDRLIRAGKLEEMPASEQERVWLRGAGLLRERGFAHYEISNFARIGHQCRHNHRYWRLDPYLGIGPAAASTLPGGATGVVRLTEPGSVSSWLAGQPPAAEQVPARDFFFENLMMGLRLFEGIPKTAIENRFGTDALKWLLETWAELSPRHGTRLRSGRFALTRRGWLLLTRLLEEMVERVKELPLDRPPNWPDGPSRGLEPVTLAGAGAWPGAA